MKEDDSLLPSRDTADLSLRLSELVVAMREAPLTEQGKSFFEDAALTLARVPDAFVNADRVMALLFLSRYSYYRGNPYGGLDSAKQAVALARRLGDEALRAKALKTLGIVYLETGSYPDMVSTLSAALEASVAAGDRFQEVEVLTNLGLAHQYAGQFGSALPCYERAIEFAGEAGIDARACSAALCNLVLANLHLKDYPAALKAAERAVGTLEQPANPHEKTIRCLAESYYARARLETGDIAGAQERVHVGRQFSDEASELAQLFLDMTQGLIDVHEPATRDIGLSRLQRAVDQSRKGAPGALRDVLPMIVRGYEIAGQPNSALVYLHEAVRLNGDQRARNLLTHHHLHLSAVRQSVDRQVDEVIEQHRQTLRVQRVSMDLLREYMLVLEKNTVAAELHDDDTGEHCYRMGALARELAKRVGMDEEMSHLVDLSARLHDIGKLRVPDAILLKPGRLNPDERAIMQSHCIHGWDLIGQGGIPQLFVAQEIALNHHERWDGKGYPNGRSGPMIPLAARITQLADVFDALTHKRCYKEAWTVEQALGELVALRGTHFDPQLIDIFLAMIPELQAKHPDLDAYLGVEARKNDFITDRARLATALKKDLGGGRRKPPPG